jgi:hypothetical protein
MRLGLQDRWLKPSGLCRRSVPRCARNGLLFQKNDHFFESHPVYRSL